MSNWFSTAVAPAATGTLESTVTAPARVKDDKHTKVRAWARSQGIDVGKRGRVPNEVIARYDAAHEDSA